MTEACDISHRPPAPDQNPDPEQVGNILRHTKTIAIIGLSNKPERESFVVGKYLKSAGYTIYPVHPNIKEWEGLSVYKRLADLPGPVDMVDLFRRADSIDGLVDEIVAATPKVVWFQLGIVNNNAAQKLRAANMEVVQDKCLKIEHFLRKEQP